MSHKGITMEDKEIEIMAWCTSKKESVSLGFGVTFNPRGYPDGLSSEWIYEGIGDSFWENYADFEPGIDKARQLACNNPTMKLEQALSEVFGCFDISYEVDGVEKQLHYDVDVNEIIYSLLKEAC